MRGIALIAGLLACALVGGCALLNQPFSCAAGDAYASGDTEIRPAIVSPQGYRHC
jgi:hypothetical protein